MLQKFNKPLMTNLSEKYATGINDYSPRYKTAHSTCEIRNTCMKTVKLFCSRSYQSRIGSPAVAPTVSSSLRWKRNNKRFPIWTSTPVRSSNVHVCTHPREEVPNDAVPRCYNVNIVKISDDSLISYVSRSQKSLLNINEDSEITFKTSGKRKPRNLSSHNDPGSLSNRERMQPLLSSPVNKCVKNSSCKIRMDKSSSRTMSRTSNGTTGKTECLFGIQKDELSSTCSSMSRFFDNLGHESNKLANRVADNCTALHKLRLAYGYLNGRSGNIGVNNEANNNEFFKMHQTEKIAISKTPQRSNTSITTIFYNSADNKPGISPPLQVTGAQKRYYGHNNFESIQDKITPKSISQLKNQANPQAHSGIQGGGKSLYPNFHTTEKHRLEPRNVDPFPPASTAAFASMFGLINLIPKPTFLSENDDNS